MKTLIAVWLFGLNAWASSAFQPLDEASFQRLVDSHKGSVVLYEFWATWCKPCQAEVPQLVQLEAKLRSRGFAVVTISADEADRETSAAKVLRTAGVRDTAYRIKTPDDDHFFEAVDHQWNGALPALFLYDRNGRKVRRFIGETDIWVLDAAIRKLL